MSERVQPSGFVPIEAIGKAQNPPRYWKSIEQPAPAEQEEPDVPVLSETSRRRFLSLMAASAGLAGMTACTRQPPEMIVPYVDPPEHAIPGKPQFFATAVPVDGLAQGVIVESHLGRPTKIEGNPDHPASLGATGVLSQASVLDLYDPDRAQQITYRGDGHSWDEFWLALNAALEPVRARKGDGFRILTGTVTSPSLGAQIQAVLQALPSAQWHQWSPAAAHSAYAGTQKAFGRPVNTYYKLDQADIVVALDSDFLTTGAGCTRYARDYTTRRRQGNRMNMNRLYAVESAMTPTGGKADHRLPLKYADVETFARELAAVLGSSGAPASGSRYGTWTGLLARDLLSRRGASAIIPGEHQSPAVHALAHGMNALLGNAGKTVIYTDPLEIRPEDQVESLRRLVADLNSGAVEILLILGGNPVYDAPADFAVASAMMRAKLTIHVGLHADETSAYCTWHVPESHFLEDWGDARAFDGTTSILQPLILPLYASHSYLEVLDSILQFPGRHTYDIVRAYWMAKSGARDFEPWWRKAVHDGVIEDTAAVAIQPALKPDWIRSTAAAAAPSAQAIEVVFRPDQYLYDGRFANNAWLEELPRSMTKLTWDNAVMLAPSTAKRLGISNQELVELHFGGRKVRGSVWIQPGHPEDTTTLHLGWGRSFSGRAGNGAGFNAYLLRASNSLWSGNDLEIVKTGDSYPLATTQMQQTMEGRNLVISDTVDRYRQEPDFVQTIQEEPPPGETLYPRWNYTGYAWGMSIDLTACVNCNACVVACQAENNIAVVGKEQVLARRAMHWLRIDTYYQGDWSNPSAYYQPVPCMQCETAPCELVCPVQATNHSADGLNDMVYNRCVGTRYCSNNCPYKVRRFNFFLFQDWYTPSIQLQRNPDVTVRSRGVMEKCTYCVQRIREAEITSQVENRFIRDGEIQTACMQACPTQAIIFGDINNKANRVAKLKAENLNYSLLAELNTRPRTTYLAELRNPNPDLEKALHERG